MNVGISVPLPAYTVDVAAMARAAGRSDSNRSGALSILSCRYTPRAGSRLGGQHRSESYSHFVDPFIALARVGRDHDSQAWHRHRSSPGAIRSLLAKEISTLDFFSGGRFLRHRHRMAPRKTAIMGGDSITADQAREAIR
jgi:hypothetical protein